MLAAILKNYVRYDFVVGNPPYVRVQTLPKEVNEYLRKNYKTVMGKFDLSVLFMERGINWLSEHGEIGFITSNKFIRSHYGDKIRNFISNNHSIRELIDFGDTGVFKDATNYPSIIIVRKNLERENKLKFINVLRPKDEILKYITKYLFKSKQRTNAKTSSRTPQLPLHLFRLTRTTYKQAHLSPLRVQQQKEILSLLYPSPIFSISLPQLHRSLE